MERRLFLKNAGLAGIIASGTAPAVVMAQENIRWRLASSFPKSLDTIYNAAEVFSKQVSEMTEGKFQISIHVGGELLPPLGVLDGVSNGTVECGHTIPNYYIGKDPAFALDGTIPFGMNTRQMTAWMYEGNGLKLTREFYRQHNIVNFPMGNTNAQMGGWYRKEVKTLEDLKGLKMRISGLAGRVVEKLGVVPQNIPGGEIYQALEKGTIDAVEWVGPYDDEKLGFNKVAPYYYFPAWWEGGGQFALYVNNKAYEALPAHYKTIVAAAASHAHITLQASYDALNPGALKRLVAAGAKLTRMPQPIMEAAFKEATLLYEELNDTNPAWKKIFTDYSAFRRDQHLWFRFAEAGFDQFMQQQRL